MMPQKKSLTVMLLTCWGFPCLGQAQQTQASTAAVQMKVVKGVPFSAKVVTESTQTLADGNRIVRTIVASLARDNDGRTRREQNLPEASLASVAAASVVFIQDPVAAVAYVLDPQSRLARRSVVSTGEIARPPVDIQGVVPKAEPTNIKTESIGTQIIEGLQAEGTRITRTLAAGQAGNERSLEIVSEIWYSPELQTIAMSRNRDPRLGETTYKLTNIQRSEPAHSLFEVPVDYTIWEEPHAVEHLVVGK